jgi:hypothetical protein
MLRLPIVRKGVMYTVLEMIYLINKQLYIFNGLNRLNAHLADQTVSAPCLVLKQCPSQIESTLNFISTLATVPLIAVQAQNTDDLMIEFNFHLKSFFLSRISLRNERQFGQSRRRQTNSQRNTEIIC